MYLTLMLFFFSFNGINEIFSSLVFNLQPFYIVKAEFSQIFICKKEVTKFLKVIQSVLVG